MEYFIQIAFKIFLGMTLAFPQTLNVVNHLAAALLLLASSTNRPITTTQPSPKQIQAALDKMHINPDINIKAAGYHYQAGFKENSSAFKFIAYADHVEDIFSRTYVPPDRLMLCESSCGLQGAADERWWDPGGKTLLGGEFWVPPPLPNESNHPPTNILRIGIIDNGKRSFTVYAYWLHL